MPAALQVCVCARVRVCVCVCVCTSACVFATHNNYLSFTDGGACDYMHYLPAFIHTCVLIDMHANYSLTRSCIHFCSPDANVFAYICYLHQHGAPDVCLVLVASSDNEFMQLSESKDVVAELLLANGALARFVCLCVCVIERERVCVCVCVCVCVRVFKSKFCTDIAHAQYTLVHG